MPKFRQYSRYKPKLGRIQDAREEWGYTIITELEISDML
jgi:hypothetical protein